MVMRTSFPSKRTTAASRSRGIGNRPGSIFELVFRVITCNLNGIRAAARKGFFAWMDAQNPDLIALQETKAQEHQLPPEALDLTRYHSAFVDAQKKGYSGVAIYAKHEPKLTVRGLGMEDVDA